MSADNSATPSRKSLGETSSKPTEVPQGVGIFLDFDEEAFLAEMLQKLNSEGDLNNYKVKLQLLCNLAAEYLKYIKFLEKEQKTLVAKLEALVESLNVLHTQVLL